MSKYLKWYLIVTESYLTPTGLRTIKFLLSHGITCLQIRFKTLSWSQQIWYGDMIQNWCRQFGVVFIVNDNLELAKVLKADGIHVGQNDIDVETCRKILGKNKIIGLSVSNAQEIKAAKRTDADYIGVGAIYPTTSKPDALIFSDYQSLKELSKPFVFIGGLKLDNIHPLLIFHPTGFAFCSFLMNNPKDLSNHQ